MVERLVLPEGGLGAAENLVGHAAGSPFEPSHDGGHRGTRFEDCMDVIWRNLPAPWGKRRFSDLDDQLRSELRSKAIDVFVISPTLDRKSTRLNSSHLGISYAV